jgi:hypothetical protein
MMTYFKVEIDEFFLKEVTKRLMPDSWCFLTSVIDGKHAYGIIFNDYFDEFLRLLNRKTQRSVQILQQKDIELLNSKPKKVFYYNLNGNLHLIPRRLSKNIPDVSLN